MDSSFVAVIVDFTIVKSVPNPNTLWLGKNDSFLSDKLIGYTKEIFFIVIRVVFSL